MALLLLTDAIVSLLEKCIYIPKLHSIPVVKKLRSINAVQPNKS